MYAILPINFDINGKREMGLKFSRLVLDPCLYSGFNLAILQSLGKSPEEMEILHPFTIGFTEIFAPSFKNLPENSKTFQNLLFCSQIQIKITF